MMVDLEVVLLFGNLMNDFLCQEISPWQCDRESKERKVLADVAWTLIYLVVTEDESWFKLRTAKTPKRDSR
jgi:hypothetical protein